MRRSLILALLLIFAVVSTADAQRRRGKRKGKSKEDREAEAALLEVKDQGPGFIRWVESFLETRAQIKITRIDTSQAPKLRLHLSILHIGEGSVLTAWEEQDDILELTVSLGSGEKRRPKPLITLGEGGVAPEVPEDTPEEERPPPALMMGMEEAGVAVDVVVIGAGHAGYRDIEGLQGQHRGAVKAAVNAFKTGRVNVIMYGPMLYTYRTFEGLGNVLSRYDEGLSECELERRRWRTATGSAPEEGADEPAPPPCGLHAGESAGIIASGVDKLRFRGKHARLFGLDRTGLEPCTNVEYSSTAISHVDLEELELQTVTDAGAFEEALRMLLVYGRPDARKAILVIGDGRDGYLDDDITCRRYYSAEEKFCAGEAKEGMSSPQARQAVLSCVQALLNTRATIMQNRFRERAAEWIALARAADIRVYAIGYSMINPSEGDADAGRISYDYERERLELLALKTGGTYREVLAPGKIEGAVKAATNEIQGEFIIELGGVLESEQSYSVQVEAILKFGSTKRGIKSVRYEFEAPFIPGGFWWWLEQKNKEFKEKVGTVLYWVIIVVAILLILLILWLLFKLLKAIFKKIFGAIFKKGAKAAKGAAKGAR